MLQCFAVCCSVICICECADAVCCSVLQCVIVCSVCCSVLQCVAVCCVVGVTSICFSRMATSNNFVCAFTDSLVLQCVAKCCIMLQCWAVFFKFGSADLQYFEKMMFTSNNFVRASRNSLEGSIYLHTNICRFINRLVVIYICV